MVACTLPRGDRGGAGDITSLPVLSWDAWGRSRLYDQLQSMSPFPPSCLGWRVYPGSPRDGGNRKTRGEALVEGGREHQAVLPHLSPTYSGS